MVAISPCATKEAAKEQQATPVRKNTSNPLHDGEQGLAESFIAGIEFQGGVNKMREVTTAVVHNG